MKKFSKKGVLLFAAAMALCAFAMPSMASASSWGVVGSHHVLTSTNFGFSSANTSSMCTSSSFTARVASTAVIEITTATFTGCTLAAPAAGATHCAVTSQGTSFPWTATAVTTSNIQIHGVNIDMVPAVSATCPAPIGGNTLRITGTLFGAGWHGNGATRTIELFGREGLVSHSAITGTQQLTLTGTVTDVQETLIVTN